MLTLFMLSLLQTEPSLRLRAVGDVMLGTDFPEGHLPADDGASSLEPVRALLQDADLTFANLEGPFCDGGSTQKCGGGKNCYAFRTPTRYGKYLVEAGIDLASTANNHAGDFGEECRRSTESMLASLGIAWSGPVGTVGSLQVKGEGLALVAFHTSEKTNNVNDLPEAIALVKKAKANHRWVVVSFHGGAEGTQATRVAVGKERFLGEDRGDLRRFAHAVVDAGADVVLGHGPHVLRGMEIYQGHLIAYSLGNFATYGRFNLSGPLAVGAILEVELDGRGMFQSGKLFPTRQIGAGLPEPDPEAKALSMVRQLSELDFQKSGVLVGEAGELSARQASPRQRPQRP